MYSLSYFRHAHEVTVLALQQLKREAFVSFIRDGEEVSMVNWEESLRTRSPTFIFWDMIVKFETMVLIFVRAHRERNFSLYVEVRAHFSVVLLRLSYIYKATYLYVFDYKFRYFNTWSPYSLLLTISIMLAGYHSISET